MTVMNRVIAGVVVFVCAGTVVAQDCPVIGPVDVSSPTATVGNGSAGSCTESALRTALTNGGTVVCNCGDGAVINVTSEILINKNTVFDGGGVILDGGGRNRILRKFTAPNQGAGLSLVIQNMTLRNGKGDSLGGAVLNMTFGSFKAVNVAFRNNSCTVQQTPDWGGGAVYSFLQKETVFSNCTFVGNSGSNGGAVCGIGNAVTIVDCVFDSSRATGLGGGADAGPTGRGGIGGAVYCDNVDINGVNNYLKVCRSVFRNSRSNAHAGAIFAYFRPNLKSRGVFDACTFEGNSEAVSQAGAIYSQNGTVSITNSTFSANTAVTQGGALWRTRESNDTGSISVTNCTFHANTLSGEYSMGGALALSSGLMTISNCTFAKNTVRHFACAIKNSGTLRLANTLLDSNMLTAGPNNNGWAGMAIDKNTNLTDLGGNLCFPASWPAWGVDEWLNQNPGVLRTNPLLQPIANNGGLTRTMAIPANSPARDQGVSQYCTPTDQRGVARDGVCDIGAYEFTSATVARGVAGNTGRSGWYSADRRFDIRGRACGLGESASGIVVVPAQGAGSGRVMTKQ